MERFQIGKIIDGRFVSHDMLNDCFQMDKVLNAL